MSRIGAAVAGALALATALVATTGVSAQSSPYKVTFVGSADAFFLILPYIANDKGFFKEENVEIDPITVQTGTREVAALMGGHADLAVCGLQNVVNVASRGGNVVALSRVFDVVLNALVLTNASMEKAGIKADMATDEKVKRLRGLQIGVSSPGASTDKVLRSFFASRGMDADKEIAIKPLGAAENLLTGLQQGVIDGFVYAAPVPDIARTRVPSTIVIDPLRGDVPEFQDAPFAALCTSRDTLEKKRPQLAAVVRAFTKAMKFASANPEEAGEITRRRFKHLDEAVFKAAFESSLKGVPTHPLLSQHQFDKLLAWVNLTEKTPIQASYLDVVYPDLARQAGQEILGK